MVPESPRRAGPFVGNGIVTSFAFGFKTLAAVDLEVVKNVGGVETTLLLDSDYSVTLNVDQEASPGGTITYPIAGSPMASPDTLTVVSSLLIEQQVDLPNLGAFYPSVIESALDRAVMLIGQLNERVDRAIVLQTSTDGVSVELPTPSAGLAIGWNDTATALANIASPGALTVTSFGNSLLNAANSAAGRVVMNTLVVLPGDTLILNVPADYATIQAAMDAAKSYRIYEGGLIRIKVADGTYTLAAGVNFNHVDGSRLEMIGNETTPANCVIAVTYTGAFGFDCFVVNDGRVLGRLNGFRFLKSSKAAVIDNTTAVLAYNGGTIICGTKIVVDNWYYGIAARDNSMIYCPSAVVNNAGDVGIWAFRDSYIYADNASSNNASDVPSNLGFGFQAEYGSTLVCSNGDATGCRIAGVAALSNSIVDAAACVSNTNVGSGFYVNESSTIYTSGAQCNNNTAWGVDRRDTSTVSLPPTGANNTGNVFGSFSFVPFTKTADFTITDVDRYLISDRGATNTVTMPNAANFPGRELYFRTIQAFTVVSASAAGGQGVIPRIGGAAGTAILPAVDGAWALLVSDGANWQIMAGS